ncbi:MAG: hypothetical protein JNJ77_19500 [Planctomycetia bacterium]|nr:hypothetical protein [Planctomycetia bacterium]
MSFSPDTPLHQNDNPVELPLHDLPLEDFPFDDPAKEEKYQQARADLLLTDDPRAKNNWWLLLFISVAAIIFIEQGNLNAMQIGVLVGVIFFHELGHAVAMRWFGYTDVRMFFIPFFGAAVTGNKHAAPAWQQAFVALMGPIPGLLLALAGYLVVRDDIPSWGFYVIVMLVSINAFNLLPLGFLDGGRFFSILIFSRNAWVEAFAQLVSAGIVAALAYWQQSIYLGVLSFFMLIGTPLIFRRGLMVSKLRQTGIALPMTVKELQPLHLRMLFAATYDVLGGMKADPKMLAAHMRELHHRVLVPPPGLLTTSVFLLVYVLAWLVAAGAIFLPVYDRNQLQEEYVAKMMNTVMPKQMAIGKARFDSKDLKGEAKAKADEKIKQLQTELRAAKEQLKPMREKLKRYTLQIGHDEVDFNDIDFDEVLDQWQKQK